MFTVRKAGFALCLVIVMILVMGCDSGFPGIAVEYSDVAQKSAGPGDTTDEEPIRAEVVIGDPDESGPYESDPYMMATSGEGDGPVIEGDTLTITVSFGGGCATHNFILVTAAAFMESDPVKLDAFLIHDDHDDPCEAYLTERLAFDLTPLRTLYEEAYGEDAGVVVLRIRDGEMNVLDEIDYEFGSG